MRISKYIVIACLSCASVISASAQSNPMLASPTAVTQPEPPQTMQAPSASLGNEPVGIGDLLYISVTGAPELTRSYRISNEGQISLPLVHEPINVAGKVPDAVAQTVSEVLVRDKILVAPIVSAAVMEYKSRQVTVTGAVKAPTIIQATGDLKLLDAITRAQGIGPEAGPEVVISKVDKENGARTSTRVSVKELLSGTNPALNIPLHGGEEIRVLEAPKFYVVGNVKMPGMYRLTDSEGTSVLRAMALSQGTLPATGGQAYVYRVVDGTNERKEITIPLKDILHRKAPDVQLQANDILYIPESSKAKFGQALGRLAGIGGSMGTGMILR